MLPTADTLAFMNAYVAFNGSNSEEDVIKYAGALLSRKDVLDFLTLPDSFDKGGLDADLVLCAVLTEATAAGLANFTGQGKAQEAILDSLLANTLLMRDMLVAGGATNGQYGQAATIYSQITEISSVLSSPFMINDEWDDRSQMKPSFSGCMRKKKAPRTSAFVLILSCWRRSNSNFIILAYINKKPSMFQRAPGDFQFRSCRSILGIEQ